MHPALTPAPAPCPHPCARTLLEPHLTSSCSHRALPAACLGCAAARSAGPGSHSGWAAHKRPHWHSTPGLGGSNSQAGSATHSARGQQKRALVSRKQDPRGWGGGPGESAQSSRREGEVKGRWGCAEGRRCSAPGWSHHALTQLTPRLPCGVSSVAPPQGKRDGGEEPEKLPWCTCPPNGSPVEGSLGHSLGPEASPRPP